MSEKQVEFLEYLRRFNSLRDRLMDVLNELDNEEIATLKNEVPTHTASDGSAPLTLAFVGQYNASKSTIIKALTRNQDIPIDADVCTDVVTAYNWEGILLLDTPGIHAGGYEDHDKLTYNAIDKANLLVFVVTSELFDDVIGEHFRKLLIDHDKAEETLLVINKMGMDPGTPEDKMPDLVKVIDPWPPEQFHTVFIDAQYYLEGLAETDATDRKELFELARFDRFEDALNKFVLERDHMGRLTSLFEPLRSVARQVEAHLKVDKPEEQAALELLDRKQRRLSSSRDRLSGRLKALLSVAASEITSYGDNIAEAIESDSTQDFVEAEWENAQRLTEARYSKLDEEVNSVIYEELKELEKQLEELDKSTLAQELRQAKGYAAGGNYGVNDPELGRLRSTAPSEITPSSNLPTYVEKTSKIAREIGTFLDGWPTNKIKDKVSVSTPKRLGKAFGVLGACVEIAAEIIKDRQEKRHTQQLQKARENIRKECREVVRKTETELRDTCEQSIQKLYADELNEIDASRDDLVGSRRVRSQIVDALEQIALEAQTEIEKIQAKIKQTSPDSDRLKSSKQPSCSS